MISTSSRCGSDESFELIQNDGWDRHLVVVEGNKEVVDRLVERVVQLVLSVFFRFFWMMLVRDEISHLRQVSGLQPD